LKNVITSNCKKWQTELIKGHGLSEERGIADSLQTAMDRKRGLPEAAVDASAFYNENRSREYAAAPHLPAIQAELTRAALALMPGSAAPPRLLLDCGCGNGLSARAAAASSSGAHVVGVDISLPMLTLGRSGGRENGEKLEGVAADMAQLPLRDNAFDGAISVSALQWLFETEPEPDPEPGAQEVPAPANPSSSTAAVSGGAAAAVCPCGCLCGPCPLVPPCRADQQASRLDSFFRALRATVRPGGCAVLQVRGRCFLMLLSLLMLVVLLVLPLLSLCGSC